MDWILYVLIGITIFEIWRNFRDTNFSWRDLLPSEMFDGEGIGCLIVLIFAGLLLLFRESREARILLVFCIAIYCGIRYFRGEQKEIQKKKMGFFRKLTEYICLILLSLMVGLFVLSIGADDMNTYSALHKAHQQMHQSKPSTNQNQR